MLEGVVRTALGVAVVRAHESRRDDRLFNDPFAQDFVDAAPGAFPESSRYEDGARSLGAVFAFHAVLRTRFFDDYLLAATAAGCQQVVLLAAGLDTRAFRLEWRDHVTVFELDLPELFAFKEAVLAEAGAAPACERRVVPVDLRDDWTDALLAAEFDPGSRTAWLAEGLLLYLTADDAVRLLDRVGRLAAPLSQLAFEQGGIATPDVLSQARGVPSLEPYASLWKGGLGDSAPDWLRQHGWQSQLHGVADIAARYGRQTPHDASGSLLTAVRAG